MRQGKIQAAGLFPKDLLVGLSFLKTNRRLPTKKIIILISVLAAAAAFLFILRSPGSKGQRDDDESLESSAGDRDNPDAAYRFRYEILAGNQQNIDLEKLRREAVGYTSRTMQGSKVLHKTSAVTWSALGPGNIGGRVRSIVINPANSSEVLIGSVSGGIWKSTDGGASWSPRSDTADVMAIGSMVVDPTNSEVVYAGTGEGWLNEDAVYGGGIFKSTDFGDSWTLLPSTIGTSVSYFRNVMKMAADSTGNIYAATKDYYFDYGGGNYTMSGGLFRSSNGGTSWTRINSPDQSTNYFTPDDVIPVSPSVIVFAVDENGGTIGGIYRTTNGGTSWAQCTVTLPTSNYRRIALAQDPRSSNILYAVFESLDETTAGDGGLKGIFKSTDGGATWTQIASPQKITSTGGLSYLGDQGWYDNVIAVDPFNSSNIFVGGIDLMKSTNGGSTWSQVSFWDPSFGSPYVHCDHHAIVFDKNNQGTIINGDDGGVYKTTDAGAHWSSLNNGLAITQFYAGAVFTTGATYYGGTQDNGHLKYSGGGSTWTEAYGGDGGYSAQDQSNSEVSYEEYVYLAMAKTTDGGVTWNNCVSGLSDANNSTNSLFIAPFAMNPENSAVLIAGSNKVWVTTNSAGSWNAASGVLAVNYHVSAVTIVNGASNYLAFAGTTSGKIFRCVNLNPSAGDSAWVDVTPGGNNKAWVRRIVVDQNSKNRVFACYGGYNVTDTLMSRHIWYSTDQGTCLVGYFSKPSQCARSFTRYRSEFLLDGVRRNRDGRISNDEQWYTHGPRLIPAWHRTFRRTSWWFSTGRTLFLRSLTDGEYFRLPPHPTFLPAGQFNLQASGPSLASVPSSKPVGRVGGRKRCGGPGDDEWGIEVVVGRRRRYRQR